MKGGPENIVRENQPRSGELMVAAEEAIRSKTLEKAVPVCCECLGAGMVSRWSEIAYFDDRRACSRCEAGRRADSKIADIVRRAQLEERLSRR